MARTLVPFPQELRPRLPTTTGNVDDLTLRLHLGQSQLASNDLYQWFCLLDGLDKVKVPSKRELQRNPHWLPQAAMREFIDDLLQTALQTPTKLKLELALGLETCLVDSPCVKANIHFPTDRILLRDEVRTLMRAVL